MPAASRALRLGPALAVAFLSTAGVAVSAEPEFPALTGRVVDAAGIVSPSVRDALTQMLARQQASTGQQVVVVTLKSLQGYTIEEYGYQLGRHWGIGEKGLNNGALLIVAPSQRKVRIEVGYGLEDRLTDALSRTIIDQQMLPHFRQGDYNSGTVEGTAAILRALGVDQAITGSPKRTIGIGTGNAIFLGVFFGLFFVLLIRGLVLQRRNREYYRYLRRIRDGNASRSDKEYYRYLRRMRDRQASRGEGYGSSGGSYSSSSGSSGSDSFSGGGGDFGGGGASDSW